MSLRIRFGIEHNVKFDKDYYFSFFQEPCYAILAK
jgi:hypothetical protein